MSRLIDAYDSALFDLDGVLYLGPKAVPGAAEAIGSLRDLEVRIGFVTNNAARSSQKVAEHLSELGIAADVADVVTSAQAGARMLARELPRDAAVLIVGTAALAEEVAKVGLRPVWSSAERPVAIIQGYDPDMSWPRLDDACYAIQAGARWFATNTDANRPTDRGRVPGAGAQIDVVASSVEGYPEVAGKPYRPLLDETVERLGARRPIFVGDRIDTDIEGATAVGLDSLFVFTGTHGVRDLLEAPISGRPTYIGWGVGALLEPARIADFSGDAATCGAARALRVDGRVVLEAPINTVTEQLDALWAALTLIWRSSEPISDGGALLALDKLSLALRYS